MQRILSPTKYPVARIPVFSGGASGEVYSFSDLSYGSDALYFAPFGIATKEGTHGQTLLEREGIKVVVHPRSDSMSFRDWTDKLVDLVGDNLPSGYSMDEVLMLLAGCDLILKGDKIEQVIGPRKINVHPAPLYILTHPETGDIVDAYGLPPSYVHQEYIRKGYRRRYVGWGTDIMPKILRERHFGASTVHIASQEMDHGPNIVVRHMRREPRHLNYPETFQTELKNRGDGPAIMEATHIILEGLEINGETLYWRKNPLPYQGLDITD